MQNFQEEKMKNSFLQKTESYNRKVIIEKR